MKGTTMQTNLLAAALCGATVSFATLAHAPTPPAPALDFRKFDDVRSQLAYQREIEAGALRVSASLLTLPLTVASSVLPNS